MMLALKNFFDSVDKNSVCFYPCRNHFYQFGEIHAGTEAAVCIHSVHYPTCNWARSWEIFIITSSSLMAVGSLSYGPTIRKLGAQVLKRTTVRWGPAWSTCLNCLQVWLCEVCVCSSLHYSWATLNCMDALKAM